MRKLLEEAKELIHQKSVSEDGNEALASYLAQLMKERGLKTQLQSVMHSLEGVSKRQFNVIGILGDPLVDRKTRKGLLLCTHLDTGQPGFPEYWTQTAGEPTHASFKDGKIFGLGAADAKLDFLCKIAAVMRLREKKMKMPVYLVGTCGAEMGMLGARYLIKSLALNPRYVMVGQPTGLKLVASQSSVNVYRILVGFQMIDKDARGFNRRVDLFVQGRSAHVASPEAGENALTKLSQFLTSAIDGGFEIRYTKLEGGRVSNQVPDRAKASFYLTSHQLEDFKRFFRSAVRALGEERAFRIELGGLGESGVRFLPDSIFPCLLKMNEVIDHLMSSSEEVLNDSQNEPKSNSKPTACVLGLVQTINGIELLVDFRLPALQSSEDWDRRLKDAVKEASSQFPQLNLEVHKSRYVPSFQQAIDSDWARKCAEVASEVGLSDETESASAAGEAAYFAQAGFDTMVFGPGAPVHNGYCPNEFNEVDQMEQAITFYEKLIERTCL